MKKQRVGWILGCTAVLAMAIPAPSQAPSERTLANQAETRIRTRVSLVNTPVTVVNAKGELVSNLEAKDFELTDNGVAQKITHLDLGSDPLSLVILIETSSRIERLLPGMRKTGIIFADAVMGPDGEAAVLGFHDSLDELVDFTTDHDVVRNTISELKEGTQGSRLFDAMAVGVEMLSSRPQPRPTADSPERRRVMVIMAEATDVGSEARFGAVLRRAQLSNVTIYSVGISTTLAELEAPSKDVRHRIQPEGTFPQPAMPGTVQTRTTEDTRYGYGNLMNTIVRAVTNVKSQITGHAFEIATSGTGGQHIATSDEFSVEKAVDEIGGELHSQYSLIYEPIGTSQVGYHAIKVRVNRKGLKVRARPGYYIAPPES
jgi:VWFA-related protein